MKYTSIKDFANPYRLSEGELAHLRAIAYYAQLSDEDKKRADKYCTPRPNPSAETE